MKIIVIGQSGAGKSTMTRELQQLLAVPVLHLDRIWHRLEATETGRAVFLAEQQSFMKNHEEWIIDGNYRGTMEPRMQAADTVIWLQISRPQAVLRVIKRSLATRFLGKKREDMASVFIEKFDREYLAFLKFIWNFPKRSYPGIEELLQRHGAGKQLIILRSPKEQARFLAKWKDTYQHR